MPPPVRVKFPERNRSVKLPVELIVMLPVLVIVPSSVVLVPLLAMKAAREGEAREHGGVQIPEDAGTGRVQCSPKNERAAS